MKEVRITFVGDFVCPFCYFGLVQLTKGLELYEEALKKKGTSAGGKILVEHGAYQLNPDIPAAGKKKEKNKSGSGNSDISRQAKKLGVQVKPARRIANTLNAHRLALWSQTQKDDEGCTKAIPILQALYELRFEQGGFLNDRKMLLQEADKLGIDRAKETLASDWGKETVSQQRGQWADMGITSVPQFVLISSGKPRILPASSQTSPTQWKSIIESLFEE